MNVIKLHLGKARAAFLGLDIGGTKTELCAFTASHRFIVSQAISTSELPRGSLDLVPAIRAIFRENLTPTVKRVGVAMRGLVVDGNVAYSSLLGGEVNQPLAGNLSRELGLPVTVRNDVSAQAVAELRFGGRAPDESMLFVNLGTGLRLSFFDHGRQLGGKKGGAGEVSLGSIFIPEVAEGSIALSDLLSGKGISNLHRLLTGEVMDPAEIFRRAKQSSQREVVEVFCRELARLLAHATFFYNPHVIVLGGSLTLSADAYLSRVRELYCAQVIPLLQAEEITVSRLEHGGCLGAIIK